MSVQSFTISITDAGNQNAYWESLVGNPAHHANLSLRTQAEIDQYTKSNNPVNPATYDPVLDAAKYVTGGGEINGKDSIRFPFTTISTGNFLACWDGRWGPGFDNWAANVDPLLQMKAFQLANSANKIAVETKWWFRQGTLNPQVCDHGIRLYGTQGWSAASGENNPLDDLTDLAFDVETWVRHWVYADFGANVLSMWLAAEPGGPLQLYDASPLSSMGNVRYFWVELNSSQSNSGVPLDYWTRNFVILKDVADPLAIVNANVW